MMKFIFLTIICGITLVFGFFAGRAHGIDETLTNRIEKLDKEKQQ